MCTADGDKPLEIRWEAIDRPLPPTVYSSNGLLKFHGITFSDAGKYVCKASNGAGTAEAVAEVLVNGNTSEHTNKLLFFGLNKWNKNINKRFIEHTYDDIRAVQPDITVYNGNSIQLRCEAREPTTIEWTRDGLPLPHNSRIGNDYLEITQVRPEDSGRYICQIRNANGVSSDYVNLRVLRKWILNYH